MNWTPEQNREYQREYQRRKRQDPEQRAKHAEYMRQWRLDNLERSREIARNSRQNNLESVRARNREWARTNKDKVRERRLRRVGITFERYDELLSQQDGGCAICGKTPEENGRPLSVDHDHSCCAGRKSCGVCIRGLLCDNHNLVLGKIKDDINIATKIVFYLGASKIEWGGQ